MNRYGAGPAMAVDWGEDQPELAPAHSRRMIARVLSYISARAGGPGCWSSPASRCRRCPGYRPEQQILPGVRNRSAVESAPARSAAA